MQVKKRDGRIVEFKIETVANCIFEAAKSLGGKDSSTSFELALEVYDRLKDLDKEIHNVEDIQDIVETVLIDNGRAKTAKAYILYRNKRTRIRDGRSELMDCVEDILKETSRENANIGTGPMAKMLQIAGEASRKYYLSRLIPEEISSAHREGYMHIHDLDFYGKTLTCLQIPLKKILTRGFNNGHGWIRTPKRTNSATALAAIILQSCQNN